MKRIFIIILVLTSTQLINAQQWSTKEANGRPVWFHDIFRKDGTPYIKEEISFIKKIIKE